MPVQPRVGGVGTRAELNVTGSAMRIYAFVGLLAGYAVLAQCIFSAEQPDWVLTIDDHSTVLRGIAEAKQGKFLALGIASTLPQELVRKSAGNH